MDTTEKIKDMLVMSYQIPFMGDDVMINVYHYGAGDVHDILFSRYYEDIPKKYLAEEPSLKDEDYLYIDNDNEYAIFINEDRVSESEKVKILVEFLYVVVDDVEDKMASEEFAARLLGDAFKRIAAKTSPWLVSKAKSSKFGLAIDQYAIPLVRDDYHVTLNIYSNETSMDVMMKMRDKHLPMLMKEEFHPSNCYGFVTKPNEDELAVFINNSKADNLLMQVTILAHELFHASKMIAQCFEGGSRTLRLRIYMTLFNRFASSLEPAIDSGDNSSNPLT